MKSESVQRKNPGKIRAGVMSANDVFPGAENRLDAIATAAYYKAQARGFAPGSELDDWLQAEAEVEARDKH